VPEQDLDDPDVGSVLEKMRREAVAQRVQRDALGQARSLHRRPAGGVQHGLIDRMIFVTPRELACRCAVCVEEMSGRPLLDLKSVRPDDASGGERDPLHCVHRLPMATIAEAFFTLLHGAGLFLHLVA
jgi:hypothetical protein